MKRQTFTDDRGQVGIGTLIVFIALVLVAAIAAGVLINTAGFLQTQAEETGQDSTSQVADNINVIGEVGAVIEEDSDLDNALDNPAIYEAKLTVQRSPGSDDIDLTGLSIQWVGDNGFAQLVHVSEKVGEDGLFEEEDVYFVQAITAESDGDAVLTDDGDRYEIVVPLVQIQAEDTHTDGEPDTVSAVNAEADGSGLQSIVDTSDASDIYNDDSDVEVDIVGDADESQWGNDDELIVIDNTVSLDALIESDNVELEITTDSGSQRNVALTAPDTLIDEEGGTVTL